MESVKLVPAPLQRGLALGILVLPSCANRYFPVAALSMRETIIVAFLAYIDRSV